MSEFAITKGKQYASDTPDYWTSLLNKKLMKMETKMNNEINMAKLEQEIIEAVNNRVYCDYTLCDSIVEEKDIILTMLSMADEVDTGFRQVDIMLKSAILDLAKKNFVIINDDKGFFINLTMGV